ncbi:unnamed protein product [Protopolystoma xenopodis]|uniref:Uncharacterized protein n=1 Tax=Protopolystoma xenopodis TaxID=117903 RepID=A0A3S5AN00_9PLAT|nr:unnamed protein product [Protopolystoma xenopodis]
MHKTVANLLGICPLELAKCMTGDDLFLNTGPLPRQTSAFTLHYPPLPGWPPDAQLRMQHNATDQDPQKPYARSCRQGNLLSQDEPNKPLQPHQHGLINPNQIRSTTSDYSHTTLQRSALSVASPSFLVEKDCSNRFQYHRSKQQPGPTDVHISSRIVSPPYASFLQTQLHSLKNNQRSNKEFSPGVESTDDSADYEQIYSKTYPLVTSRRLYSSDGIVRRHQLVEVRMNKGKQPKQLRRAKNKYSYQSQVSIAPIARTYDIPFHTSSTLSLEKVGLGFKRRHYFHASVKPDFNLIRKAISPLKPLLIDHSNFETNRHVSIHKPQSSSSHLQYQLEELKQWETSNPELANTTFSIHPNPLKPHYSRSGFEMPKELTLSVRKNRGTFTNKSSNRQSINSDKAVHCIDVCKKHK